MPDITLAEVNELLSVADGSNVLIALDLIGWSECTATEAISINQGYDVIVTGIDPNNRSNKFYEEVFTDYTHHPFELGRPAIEVQAPSPRFPKGLYSTASGRYQIILSTYKALKAELGLQGFYELDQDKMAIQLIRERRGLDHVSALTHLLDGNFATAIVLMAGIWASLPGNSYGQGGKSMSACISEINNLAKALK